MNLRFFGQLFMFLAAFFLLFGVVLYFADKLPWIGRLPGDFLLRRKNFVFYFPIMTCILLSLIISVIFSLFFRR